MPETGKIIRVTMAVLVGAAVLLGLFHAADDFARGEVTRPRSFAFLAVAASTLYMLGLLWSWQGRWYGDALVLLLSALFFYSTFLSHALAALKAHPMLRIAKTTGPFFVFVSLTGGVSSLTAGILAGYLLARRRGR